MDISAVDAIPDIRWVQNQRLENGEDSFVVPFPRLTPANIVFHGESKFDYGHYGIHLGQADILTFLGSSERQITAHFIDCRAGSPYARRKASISFSPSSARALCIPPGVAHAFDGLEGVHTINSYELYLPKPEDWVSGRTEWTLESDVINVPMNAEAAKVPLHLPNSEPASDLFYQLLADRQRTTIPTLEHEYPFTEEVTTQDGSSARLMLRKRLERSRAGVSESEMATGIDGVRWERHLVVWSGPNSGFVPLLDAAPYYVVDHGHTAYSHDAFGIHMGQEDRLTFLGPTDQQITLQLVDCRRNSVTRHAEATVRFSPDPKWFLIIPNGVAHRFLGLERVYTLNRPKVFLGADGQYDSSTDVIDWPVERTDYPDLEPNAEPAPPSYYKAQVEAQRSFLQAPPSHGTPVVLLTRDAHGKEVRVALRRESSPV